MAHHSRNAPSRPVRLEPIQSDAQPEDVFRKIENFSGCFFLDSALFNPRFGRYSFLGVEPMLTLRADGDLITLRGKEGEKKFRGNPFETLRKVIRSYAPLFEQFSPGPPFVGGLVGYLGYDLRHFTERLPASARRDQRFPDMYFGLYESNGCLHRRTSEGKPAPGTSFGKHSRARSPLRLQPPQTDPLKRRLLPQTSQKPNISAPFKE